MRPAVIVDVEMPVLSIRIKDTDLDHCAFSSVGPEARRRRRAPAGRCFPFCPVYAGRHIITAYSALAPAAAPFSERLSDCSTACSIASIAAGGLVRLRASATARRDIKTNSAHR